MKVAELSNDCNDITHGEGPLHFILTLSSEFPALSQLQFSDLLHIQLQLNFSLIPKILNQGTDYIIHTTDISILNNWTGGKSVQLEIERAAVPGQVMQRIMSSHERFRAQVKLVFNGVTAAE